jgi:Amt family ammonium transporter
MEEIKFALDTFYAIMAGALVMWMAAGFTMLEAGLVQKKDVSEIVTKNLGLYSIACIMYLACGFVLMYPGGAFVEGIIPSIGTSWGLSTAMPLEEIGMEYGMDYSQQADFFFQVVFVATAMSIVSGSWTTDWSGTADCAVLTDCTDLRSPDYPASWGTDL